MAAVPEMRRNMQYTESERLFEASKKCIPGGVNSPVRAYQAVHRTAGLCGAGERFPHL